MGGCRDTCRKAHGHGKPHRGSCEFSGRSDTGGDLVGDRPPGDRGPAEIEGRKPLQPLLILDVHGPVQAEQLTDRLDVCGRGVRPRHHLGRVARDGLEDAEDDE